MQTVARSAEKREGSSLLKNALRGAALAAAIAVSANSPPAAAHDHSQHKNAPETVRIVSKLDSEYVFITIDDGWFPSKRVLGLLKQERVPTTTFLIGEAIQGHRGFWKDYSKIGSIQDHTLSHPFLTGLSFKEGMHQIEADRDMIQKLTGAAPYMMRPPYGSYSRKVTAEAAASSMKYEVLWDAEVPMNRRGYIGERLRIAVKGRDRLEAGDIILMHWDPGLYPAMKYLLNEIKHDKLKVGSLEEQLRD